VAWRESAHHQLYEARALLAAAQDPTERGGKQTVIMQCAEYRGNWGSS
jgi:hypothetical protein